MAKKSKKEELDFESSFSEVPKEKKEPQVKTFFKVKDGMSLTSKRGILSSGAAVSAKDFSGGEETLKTLFKKGFLVESSH